MKRYALTAEVRQVASKLVCKVWPLSKEGHACSTTISMMCEVFGVAPAISHGKPVQQIAHRWRDCLLLQLWLAGWCVVETALY